MQRVLVWIQAARPKTLIASVSPVMIGAAISLSFGIFEPLVLLVTLLTALGIQIGTNFANDYFDFVRGADTPQRKGPVRVTQAGLVSMKAIKWATALVFLLTAISGSYLVWHGGAAIALVLGISILLGILYTGGPYPIAYLGISELFVFIFYGPVATVGTFYLQTHHFSWAAALSGIGPGAISCALLIINNLRDIDEDKLARKKTLIVRFGKLFGKWEYAIALLTASFAPLFCVVERPYVLIASLFIFPAVPVILKVFRNEDPYALNQILQKTAQLLAIYTLLFCISWML